MKAELEIKNFLKAINEFRTPEQQPCCVQVVERVGLVTSGFQFLPHLATVFAEEVGDLWGTGNDGQI